MRTSPFLTSAILIALTAGPALAQTTPPPNVPIARPGNPIGTGQSLPLSNNASNISATDTHSSIAPNLPAPPVGDDASPRTYLTAARQALVAGRTGEAQEALERAESRALDRDVRPSLANQPSQQPLVTQIANARAALSTGNTAQTIQLIDAALQSAPG